MSAEEGYCEFAAIQRSKKEREMDELENVTVDNRLRATMAAAFASIDGLQANASKMDK